MSNAMQFVEVMRNDKKFREHVRETRNTVELKQYLMESGFDFSEHDLVCAMAACMEEMEKIAGYPDRER